MLPEDKPLNLSRERIKRLLRLSIIPRWSIVPTLREQTVADHCFQVVWMALWIADIYRASPKAKEISTERIMKKAIVHDEAESVSGDFPAPLKGGLVGAAVRQWEKSKDYGHVGILLADEATIVKLADLLECLLWVRSEMLMGNTLVKDVYEDIRRRFKEAWEGCDALSHQSYAYIIRQFEGCLVGHPGLEEVETRHD